MRKRLSVFFLFWIFWFLGADFLVHDSAVAENAPRLTISIFKYSGIRTERHENEFDAFKEIIVAKILKLTQEFETKGNRFDYISHLTPSFVSDLASNKHLPFIGSQKDLYDHWYSSGALEVLLGRIRSTGSIFSVRSEVFLGDLKGNLENPSLTLDLSIVDEQFDTTRDSHTLITLYALAMDAQGRGRPKDEVLTFLSEAYGRLPDLCEDMPGIKDLKKALIMAIEQLRTQHQPEEQ